MWDADKKAAGVPNTVPFNLSAQGGAILIYDAATNLIDRIDYPTQSAGVSEGRLPDGAATIVPFTATVTPVTATLPITYRWEATGQTPVPHSAVSARTDSVSFSWDSPGTKAITVTATNLAGSVVGNWTINIEAQAERKRLYLPLVLRGS